MSTTSIVRDPSSGTGLACVSRRGLLAGTAALTLPVLLAQRTSPRSMIRTAAAAPTEFVAFPVGQAASDGDLVREKLDQATRILDELDIDLWMPVARESDTLGDPSLPLIAGTSVTWESAFLISRTGHHRAVVGSGDVENLKQTGAWDDVVGYVEDFGSSLREAVASYDPQSLALDFSIDNFMADGLTFGMYLRLEEILGGTPYWARVISGEPVAARVRSRKSAAEQRRLAAAVATTVEIWDELAVWLRPGQTEREIAAFMHGQLEERGITSSWDWNYCPTVIAGPDSPGFHAGPGDFPTRQGELLAIDFGVKQELYCSDMQRTYYFLKPGESEPPALIRESFAVVDDVIQSAAAALRPGVHGWEVDKVGRDIFAQAEFEEWPFALGHQLGRAEHDGGTLLAPHWERYGVRPDGVVEADEVYALEIGSMVAGFGWASLEEDLVVTAGGSRFFSEPQRELIAIGGA
ncbi:MAG: M24 family metallopeptidase [Thermomicrobiales bacterium]